MQKAILKVFLVDSKKPLFQVDIYDNIEETIENFADQVSDETNFLVKFGEVAFKRELFHHYEYELKN